MEYGKKIKKKVRVFVAMSGGVDSSVAAALLTKNKKYNVSGVFIKGFYPKGVPCGWREDRRDAIRVSAKLGIPFYTFDFSKEYKKHVIDYMIKEYGDGRTPNADIMCNKYIKFDLFLKKALEMGADYISTGHYVKLETCNLKHNKNASCFMLHASRDTNKDQSYFLWTLTQKQLKYCLFPVGDYLKDEVRQMAKKFKLPVFNKKDSQGLCFVGEFKMEDFLKNYIKPKSGTVLNQSGEVVGKHNGVQYYTIGQRQGTGAQGKEPYYVVEKDLKKNILIVAPESEEKKFYKKEILIKNVSWESGKAPDFKKEYLARIRYRQSLQKCKLKDIRYPSGARYRISFKEPQRAVASGQSFVLYDKNILLGGGIIM